PLLTPAFSSCNNSRVNEPKYKCPRCAIPTCSLPCSKRHKLWSQCSGVRDPAAYLKRKELATPVAFDKDFNFLSGIERYVERAERDAENRGIELAREDDGDGNGDGGRRQQWRKKTGPAVKKGEVGLLSGIERAGVRVVRAPKGMSRGRQNMSYWHKKHKCLNWTIEWILVDDDDQSQVAISKCLESTSVATAFSRTSLSKQNDAELNTTSPHAKKRKLDSETIPLPSPSTTHNTHANTHVNPLPLPENQTVTPCNQTPASRTLSPEPRPTANLTQNLNIHTEESSEPENETVATTTSIAKVDGITNANTTSGIEPLPYTKYHIYLHRPRSRCRVPVLIPLADSVTITDALRGRTVLEFPTFYVLPWPAGELPADKFMLEEAYLKEYGNGGMDWLEGTEKEEEKGEEAKEEGGKLEGIEEDNVLRGVDEKKVLEVLCQDLEVVG
ncbi:hypothetical protein ACJ72_07698, partial [Emergomyces africanus]